YQFLIWFKDAIILYPDIEVFDTKDRGANIDGAIQMSLNDLISKYGVEDGSDNSIFCNKKSTFNEEEMKGIRKFLSDTYEELHSLKRKAKDAIKICEEQIRIYKNNFTDNHITEKNFKKISKINEYIYKQSSYHLIDVFITAEATQQISELYKFTDDENQDKIATYEKSIAIFNAIIEGSDFTREVFDKNMEYI
ncbi:MAG: motility associated factor glycosyltransferase family protein, partial [Clostridiales bacterium]|nr:motility associated factor glycosyltransferase family protein [Clostridiales bacterium]